MTNANKKTTKTEERNAINAAIAAGKAITKLPAKTSKKPKAKKSDVVSLPAPDAKKPVKGSVVPAAFKAKAGKSGVMKQDDLNEAVRNAILAAGSNDLTPTQSARIAVDEILQANGLDVGRWEGKNAGMLSMNLRNVLRGIRRNGENVLVGGKVLKALAS